MLLWLAVIKLRTDLLDGSFGAFAFFAFEHFPAEFALGDLEQCYIGHAEAGGFRNECAGRSAAREAVELPHAPGNQIYQNVWIAYFFECFSR